jgi:hypothetical protein
VPQSFLDGLSRPLHFSNRAVNLGVLKAPIAGAGTILHTNMYGQEYPLDSQSPYSPINVDTVIEPAFGVSRHSDVYARIVISAACK